MRMVSDEDPTHRTPTHSLNSSNKKKRSTMAPKLLGVGFESSQSANAHLTYPIIEDQQRINTFSKLNARHTIIEGKLKNLKVGTASRCKDEF